MSRKRASVRREEILAATIEEIESSGLRTLRVADVARRLGLSPSLVIYHFVTKEALVAAAFAHAGENDLYRARRIAATGRSAREKLDEVIAWYMPTGSTRSWKIWIDGWSAGLFDAELRATFAALDKEWKAILASLIDAGREAGEFTQGADSAQTIATRILAYLDGLAIQAMFHTDAVTRELMIEWVSAFVAHELEPPS
ncbi:TetR family transcriptional regulator C-terminal domain-containing protein [Brevibacterium sp.]|uniref:TetR/AcrR family transcriptional regulator n=1 Tax=Brevibacterium sp. TaxID=1701 RepID=UPI002811C830|nr:TetR family transcriptional regulator C-terminal domain-containing protein [Brevibacterium sp.]